MLNFSHNKLRFKSLKRQKAHWIKLWASTLLLYCKDHSMAFNIS